MKHNNLHLLLTMVLLHIYSQAISQTNVSLEGSIIIGYSEVTEPGRIRWTGSNFEGFNGYGWIPLSLDIPETITDIDSNEYRIVKIGHQTWMADNLRVQHFNDGTEIDHVTDNSAWSDNFSAFNPAYCWYDNDSIANNITKGLLYNAFIIDTLYNDNKSICPLGWRLPKEEDALELQTYLGGQFAAGGKLKLRGTELWTSPNVAATNEVGFNAGPGGMRGQVRFSRGNTLWSIWLRTKPSASAFRNAQILAGDFVFYYDTSSLLEGHSIRCIKL